MAAPERNERPLGDLGRRLAARRADLGLTRDEVADRAGMAPSYVRYLEEHPGSAPDRGTLLGLAAALETTVPDLTGGTADLPPGLEEAVRGADFSDLGEDESRTLLGSHGVGRIALPTDGGPVVVPVNYSVVDGAVVYRTAPGTTPALAAGHRVAFEVDRIDDAFSRGWSVLVRGDAREVTDPAEITRLDAGAYTEPWAGGDRRLWISVDPAVITGRRISV
ncbi:pyridoxamine 5'-phosphate oxidase family protein [Streptomyces sp. NPDC048290]|uniref:helix-turn-helix domain-containing protein n=1 Tax=Streptomyces sp. NPDC048290 TaxID=3155811 RepID=UPI00341A4683